MKILVIQHSSINTLGTIGEYAKIKNHALESIRFYETHNSPAINPFTIDSFDLLIVMGGAIGVYDYKENPWLRNEKDYIKQAVNAGKPILGICLGAQLLADSLGACVHDNKYMEMGWFPVKAVSNENISDFLKGLLDEFVAFHWHSRTFDLPEGAVHLFESRGCKNQGFIYGDRVVALQFHPEVNEERIESLIKRYGDGMAEGLFVQKKMEMLGQKKYLAETKEFMFAILEKLEELILKI
jgi:GMP synthase-like glutamine amidotransferase